VAPEPSLPRELLALWGAVSSEMPRMGRYVGERLIEWLESKRKQP
jgi:hypothetical protein